jgi:hypothetical protein
MQPTVGKRLSLPANLVAQVLPIVVLLFLVGLLLLSKNLSIPTQHRTQNGAGCRKARIYSTDATYVRTRGR